MNKPGDKPLITINKKQVEIGYFKTEKEAHMAYKKVLDEKIISNKSRD